MWPRMRVRTATRMTPEEQQNLNVYLMQQQEQMMREELLRHRRNDKLYLDSWNRTHDGIVDTETEDLESEMDANPYNDEAQYDANSYNDEYRFTGPAYDDEPER